jgi:general secretion pathway protein D
MGNTIMKIGRSFIFLCLIFVIAAIPGCGGRKQQKSSLPADTKLQTSIDLPEFADEKLSKIGISSEPGEIIAAEKEQNEVVSPQAITEEKIPKEEELLPCPEEEPSIEFHFENADLEMLINQISELFDVTFVADDSITPMLQGAKTVKGNKISFKTQRPLTRKDAWDLFLTFLDIAGFAIISEANPKLKRIVTIDLARKSPLKAFIGVPASELPNSDEMVRYVYFLENISLETVRPILESLRSPNSSVAYLLEMKAFVITDKAYNIKSLMSIIKELDKVVMPQSMSVLKLRRADAKEVKALYDSLAQVDEKSLAQQRFFPARKSSPSAYFSENVAMFAEPRTNSLILLGPQDAIKRIEDFIIQSVDVDLTQPYSPLHVLTLRYADAKTIADIMNTVTKFGETSEAAKNGGVRGGDKYMKPITFTPEFETNRIIVKGDYEDFLRAKEVITELDAPQPQVAIEVLLLSVSLNDRRQLGAQIRSREPGSEGLAGSNVKYQTSGLFGTGTIVTDPNGNGVNRLLGNLLNLVSSGIAAGNTIISLGDSLNVWAIIQALQTASNVQVLANPFLIATNKSEAVVSLGEVRRVTTGTIVGGSNTQTNTYGDAPAELKVVIRPQINSDGMIVLDIVVKLSQFVGAANPDNAVRTTREIKTKTIVTNKEVIALGGLIQTNIENTETKVPVLGDIPIVGWFFKNKTKIANKSNLLILISSRIIEPQGNEAVTAFTQSHLTDYTDTINEMYYRNERRDPVNRWFFRQKDLNEKATDEFIFRRQKEALAETTLHKDIVTPIAQANPTTKKTVVASNKKSKSPLMSALENEKGASA